MTKYQCTLSFETDEPLTDEQLGDLRLGLTFEADSPCTSDGDYADWGGHNVCVDIFEVTNR